MMYVLDYKRWRAVHEAAGEELPLPSVQVLLDGTSSSGKSVVLEDLSSDWCVLAADEFYDLMAESLGEKSLGNKQKISEVYPDCPYGVEEPGGEEWEGACRWYMVQEAKWGRANRLGLVSRNGKVGRSRSQDRVIYDDVQGTVIKEAGTAGLPKPRWILVHAPIDHLLLNISRRPKEDGRDARGVLVGAYCFKYEAKAEEGGVDPQKSWTRESVRELLADQDWKEEFLEKLGMTEEDQAYWMHVKSQPEGEYDVIVNTRDSGGGQLPVEEVRKEVSASF